MLRTTFRFAGPVLAALIAVHCGSLSGESPHHTTPDASAGDDGSAPDSAVGDAGCDGASTYHGPPSSPPSGHRASATACAATPYPYTDGGHGPSCGTNLDCVKEPGPYCLHFNCSTDACLSDSDCGAGQACGCVANGAGRNTMGNVCVTVGCRVDADCSAGNYCIPTKGTCGDLVGYYCTSKDDECLSAADCPCGANQCAYSPMAGHRVCATATCMG